jgi:3-methyladenine DNA glycosylase AlkD
VRKAARGIKRAVPIPTRQGLIAELESLFASNTHEDRLLAILTAQQFVPVFRAADVKGTFSRWLANCHGWDLVDALSTFVVGHVALDHPTAWCEIAKWAYADSFWVRRASVLAHIPVIRAGQVDMNLLRKTCAHLVEEKEFFIRKAVGWVLREMASYDPKQAEPLIMELGPKASGLTLREATRRFPEATRRRIYRRLGRPLPRRMKTS